MTTNRLNIIHVQGFFNHAVRESYRGAIVANVDGQLWLSDSCVVIPMPEVLNVPRIVANLAPGYGVSWYDEDSQLETSEELGAKVAFRIYHDQTQTDRQSKYDLTPWRCVAQPGSIMVAVLTHAEHAPIFIQQRYVRLFNEHLVEFWKDPSDPRAPVIVMRKEPETGMVGAIMPMQNLDVPGIPNLAK